MPQRDSHQAGSFPGLKYAKTKGGFAVILPTISILEVLMMKKTVLKEKPEKRKQSRSGEN
jgi:hypothetical protein